ncbi:MAG: hypothetical protein KDJ15_01875 [Alphaproteobacteria bacterium]|nr:hypothetical protein [Alphaproteobacteria bacterium]
MSHDPLTAEQCGAQMEQVTDPSHSPLQKAERLEHLMRGMLAADPCNEMAQLALAGLMIVQGKTPESSIYRHKDQMFALDRAPIYKFLETEAAQEVRTVYPLAA